MEQHNDLTPQEHSVYWQVDEPAPQDELQSFWKKLRHFYRTGEKSGEGKPHGMSSALGPVFSTSVSAYPFFPFGNAKSAIELSPATPIYMLDYILSSQGLENRKRFKGQLSELIVALQELLKAEKGSFEGADEMNATYDFADDLIAFDKLNKVVPKKRHQRLSTTQTKRLKSVLETLKEGAAGQADKVATVFVQKELQSERILKEAFLQAQLIVPDQDIFEQAHDLMTHKIHAFAELVKAHRIGALEISGNYEEAVHDGYFEHFTWHRLFDDELAHFLPVVVLVNRQYVFDHLSSYSKLLASNLPIKMIVLKQEAVSTADTLTSWEDASHQFRQELTPLTIAHRNVYVLQTGLDQPADLFNQLNTCIKSYGPGVCHVLAPDENEATPNLEAQAKAAKAARYFPTIIYDPHADEKQGSRLNLAENIQSKNLWPQQNLNIQTPDDTQSEIQVDFTYADYKAMYQQKAEELMLIPSGYYTDDLIALADYIKLDEKKLYGKIPFIWLIDDENQLHKAAVPNVWVVSCQERADFWAYLQDISRINDMPVKTVTEPKVELAEPEALTHDSPLYKEMREEIRTELDKVAEARMAKLEEEALLDASKKVVSALLALGQEGVSIESLMTLGESDGTNELPAQEPVQEEKPITFSEQTIGDIKDETSEPAPESVVNKEAWVESDDCTSCNDCIDKYGHMFAYNAENQAYIKDASKGKFEELVKAAENCPAACIHPGLPLNPKESNLDALIKRAEKFN